MRLSAALAIVLMSLPLSVALAQPRRLEIGLDRSNLTWESLDVQAQVMRGIRALGGEWVRDALSGHSPATNSAFVQELELAKRNNLKFLAIVGVGSEDYDTGYRNPNAGELFDKVCGWKAGSPEVSRINLAKFKVRLKAQLDAVKAAGLTIDAFEIGNEYNSSCFDADVPFGRLATPQEFQTMVLGYAHLLRAAADIIESPNYFLHAPIVTFGIAHLSDADDPFDHHIENPDRIIDVLKNLGGFDYLDNAEYHVAGIGSHIYVSPDVIDTKASQILTGDSLVGGGRPVWITEWGFNTWAFRTRSDLTRKEAFTRFYAMLRREPIRLGPNFVYAYSQHKDSGWGLVGKGGQLLPEASVITEQSREH